MKTLRVLVLLAVCASSAPHLLAINNGTQPKVNDRDSLSQVAATKLRQLEQRIDSLSMEVQKRDLEIQELKLKVEKKPETDQTAMTGKIAAGAVIAAALIALLSQILASRWQERVAMRTAENNLRLAREGAIYKNSEKIFDYRLKQLQEFYAPMSALQKQSKALYNKLLVQLPMQEPARYRAPGADAEHDFRLEVKVGEKWEKFYLLDQLPAIRKNPSAFALVTEIVRIGGQMTETISKNAGLAKPEILEVLSEYMGHYAILASLYRDESTTPFPPGWHKMGYYPYQKFDDGIQVGYKEMVDFLDGQVRVGQSLVDQSTVRA